MAIGYCKVCLNNTREDRTLCSICHEGHLFIPNLDVRSTEKDIELENAQKCITKLCDKIEELEKQLEIFKKNKKCKNFNYKLTYTESPIKTAFIYAPNEQEAVKSLRCINTQAELIKVEKL